MQPTKRHLNQKGFTLIEIAIVLTIVGLIIGGIWLAASTVFNNNKKQLLSQEVVQIVQNAKGLFQSNPAGTTNFTTANALSSNIFPGNMGTTEDTLSHPYSNGTKKDVTLAEAGGVRGQLALTLGAGAANIPQDACIALASQLAAPANFTKYGLISVGVGAKGTATIAQGATISAITSSCAALNKIIITFGV